MKLRLRFVDPIVVALTSCAVCSAEMPREEAWKVLNSGLTNSNTEKRTKDVAELGLLVDDQQAEDAALTALKDDKSEGRPEAAQALGEMGMQAARPQLTDALKDDDVAVV